MIADGFSRGTDNPLGGVVEDAPRVWRVGDVVEGADAYASLPVGTTLWSYAGEPGSDLHEARHFWTKAEDGWIDWCRERVPPQFHWPRVIRSLPADYAAPEHGKPAPASPRVWRVGDTVEGAEAYASLPVGTVIEPRGIESGPWVVVPSGIRSVDDMRVFLTSHNHIGWPVGHEHPRVIRSLPADYVQRGEPEKPAPFNAASAPVGTVVDVGKWQRRRFVKHPTGDGRFVWLEDGTWESGDGYVSGIVSSFDPSCVTVTYPPAPAEWREKDPVLVADQLRANAATAARWAQKQKDAAERQPCAAWVDNGNGTWSLGKHATVEEVKTILGNAYHVRVRRKFHDSTTTLRAAQLAAEDALEAERQELGRLLGKGCA